MLRFLPCIADCVLRFLLRMAACASNSGGTFWVQPCLLRLLPCIAARVLRFLPRVAACASGGTLQTLLYTNCMNTCSHACSHVHTLCLVQWRQLARTHVAKNNRKRESCSFLYAAFRNYEGATHALLCRSARLCFSSSWLILISISLFLPLVNHWKTGRM